MDSLIAVLAQIAESQSSFDIKGGAQPDGSYKIISPAEITAFSDNIVVSYPLVFEDVQGHVLSPHGGQAGSTNKRIQGALTSALAASAEPTIAGAVPSVLAVSEELLIAHNALVRMAGAAVLDIRLIVGDADHEAGGSNGPLFDEQNTRHGLLPQRPPLRPRRH